MFSTASATEIESGYFKASSTGTLTEKVGFRPDYIEFITAQQIEQVNFHETDPQNYDCPENVNGWAEGSVIFDGSGTSPSDVRKQFSIGIFRNSDSTNGHKIASSTSDVIKNLYVSQDANLCGTLEVKVVRPTSKGFKVDIQSVYDTYNEVVRYKAYQFPDNMNFDAGMVKINSKGKKKINTGFQPANLHIRGAQQLINKDTVRTFYKSDLSTEMDTTHGRTKGYATLDRDGNVIDQQSIGTASNSHSTNGHRSLASDSDIINTVYVDREGREKGRFAANVVGADSTGFTIDVTKKYADSSKVETDEVFLYRAWGFSYYEFDIGYRVIGNRGEKFFSTGFKPDAIDIYAEQQITSINKEIQTPSNSGCANAGGWSNGFYEADDNRQWSITIGRTSASQNTHRYGASTHFGLRNLYRGGSGNRVSCGNFTGKVTSTNKTGFNMSFDFNSKFENNYGKEMVYFRAFDFKIAPPQVKTLRFENLSTEHAFKVIANISEGSNDISDCDITANSSKGNFMVYDGSVDKINSSWSRCTYNSVSYDDVLEWENRHDDSGELIKLNVTVNASDVDGQWSEKTETAKFHNNPPTVKKLEVTNYSYSHRFNFTSKVFADAYTPEELVGCKIKADDLDGNVYTFDGTIDHSVGGAQVAECEYDNINSSDIPGFEPEEKINVTVNLTDRRDVSGWNFSLHEIPNNPPTAYSEEPEDGGIGLGEPLKLNITVSDPDSDFLNVWFLNATDSTVIDYETSPSGQQVTGELPGILVGEEYEWYVKVGDGATNFTSPVFSFTKAVSRSFQVQLAIQHRYSDVIMSPDSTRQVFLEVRNQVPGKKTLTTMLKGDVEAAFADGSESKNYEIKGKSMRRFSITISPGSTGEHTLKVVTRNEDIGVNTSTSIPVRVKDFTTTTRVELPGIQLLQLVMLSLAGAATYYLRL